jgi:hypothetical protein
MSKQRGNKETAGQAGDPARPTGGTGYWALILDHHLAESIPSPERGSILTCLEHDGEGCEALFDTVAAGRRAMRTGACKDALSRHRADQGGGLASAAASAPGSR